MLFKTLFVKPTAVALSTLFCPEELKNKTLICNSYGFSRVLCKPKYNFENET